METADQEIEAKDAPRYVISAEEFKVPPTTLEENVNFGRVTRNNFTSTLINTFARSRGIQSAQLIMLNWMYLHDGWDYRKTLRNLTSIGGFGSLSEEEKGVFVDTYVKVGKHTKEISDPDSSLESNIFKTTDEELSDLLRASYVPEDSYSYDVVGKYSKSEMLSAVSHEIHEIQESKRQHMLGRQN